MEIIQSHKLVVTLHTRINLPSDLDLVSRVNSHHLRSLTFNYIVNCLSFKKGKFTDHDGSSLNIYLARWLTLLPNSSAELVGAAMVQICVPFLENHNKE